MTRMHSQFIGSPNHTEVRKASRNCKNGRNFSRDNFVNKNSIFKEFIKTGPYFICIVCNRCLYKISVRLFSRSKHREFTSDLHVLLYEKFLSENEPQKPLKLKKMLRKSPASNVWAAIFENADFSWSSL